MGHTVDIPFGDATQTVELPDHTFFVPYGGGKKAEPIDDLEGAVSAALEAPLDSPPIEALVSPASRVTIAFDDPTVPAYGPIRRVALLEVLEQLERAGVDRRRITVICANALHRKFPPEELALTLGDDLVRDLGDALICHDAEDPEQLVHLGQTEQGGYDVELSRPVVDADLTIYINAAHYRGFAGGWKSICVGLSTFRSIRQHHTPDGMSMSLHDNPMHTMLDEMGAHTEKAIPGTLFKIDTVEANPFQSAAVFAGNTWSTRKAAVQLLDTLYPPRRALSDERYDVILYGVPNWSPYAIYASMNPLLTLVSSGLGYLGGTIRALGKPDCTVIMATPCPLQWDRVHHPSYPDVWENVLPETTDPYEIEARYTEHYGRHEAYIDRYRHHYAFHPVHGILATHPLRRLRDCGQVIVAGIEDAAVAHRLGFAAAASVPAALEAARERHGPGFSLAYAQHPAAPTKVAM